MRLVKFAVTHPVTISMGAAAAVLFGLVAAGRLPMTLLPDISYPTLTIQTEYADAAPEEVEALVTNEIEQSVSVVRGLRAMRSSSRPGWSTITLEFAWETDMDYASLDVREKIDLVDLPDDAESPVLLRYDPNLDPILRIGLHGDLDLVRLRYLADEVLQKDLESLDGVASVRVTGGLEEEIQVDVDGARLSALGIPITRVTTFLDEQNVNTSGGRLRDRESEFLVRAVNEFDRLQDIEATVLDQSDGRVVKLGDVANVARGYKDRDVITRVSAQESVELAVYREGDANTVAVADRVQRRLAFLGERLPEEVSTSTLFDQSVFIRQAISEVRQNAVVGGVLAVLVLLAFLRDVRSTAIIAASIPLSILVTFVVMGQLGISLNIMSLGGLALAVGMLVDNSVVVLESIARKREEGEGLFDAAYHGASQVGRAVIASTLTTVAVFLPIIFVEGVAGEIFDDQAKTVTSALAVSLVIALTLIPMLAALGGRATRVDGAATDLAFAESPRALPPIARPTRWIGWVPFGLRHVFRFVFFTVLWRFAWALRGVMLGVRRAVTSLGRRGGAKRAEGARPLARLEARYARALAAALDRRGLVVGTAFVAAALAAVGVLGLGRELIPRFTQGEFSLELEMPAGTPQTVTDRVVGDLEHVLVGDPEVGVFFTKVGAAADFGGDVADRKENLAQLGVRLADPSDEDAERRLIERLRGRLDGVDVTDVRFSRPSYFTFDTPVEVEVIGYDLEQLGRVSEEIASRLRAIPGLRDVQSSVELGNPEVQVRFDRERMALLGIELTDAARLLRNQIRGQVATTYRERDRQLDVRVRAAGARHARMDEIAASVVSEVDGVPILLSSIAEVSVGRGPSEVTHVDHERAAVVSADVTGRDLGSVTDDIRATLASMTLPPEVRVTLAGQNDELDESFRSLVMAVLLAAFMVYLVMAAQFESFLHPFVIMFTVPLGLIGVVAALVVTSTPVSVVVFIGVILLCGIVVNNAIVLIDYVNQLRAEGVSRREALVKAGRHRLRPILITSLTTILGLLPMALGLGEGAEIRAPMAIAVIGGLSVGAFLTLFLIPVLYDLADGLRAAIVRPARMHADALAVDAEHVLVARALVPEDRDLDRRRADVDAGGEQGTCRHATTSSSCSVSAWRSAKRAAPSAPV